MAGPTPITAGWRLTFLYSTRGFQHRAQHYLSVVTSADPTGFDVVGRVGTGNAGLSACRDALFTLLAPFYRAADCSFDGVVLYQRVGTEFVFLTSSTTAVVPTGASAPQLAYQYAIAKKDANNRALNRYFYETGLFPPDKRTSVAALNAAEVALVDFYANLSPAPAATDAWNWELSKGGIRPQRWISVVTDTNEKLRRLRRIK